MIDSICNIDQNFRNSYSLNDQKELIEKFNNIIETTSQLYSPYNNSTESAWTNSYLTFVIPENVDIFSDLSKDIFNDSFNKQRASLMREFQKAFFLKVSDKKIDAYIPKLIHFVDEDSTDMIRLAYSWEQGSFMVYFAFEKNCKESSYGVILNDNKRKNYESRIKNIELNDENEIVQDVCNTILNVFL